jgi:hypothetical protein
MVSGSFMVYLKVDGKMNPMKAQDAQGRILYQPLASCVLFILSPMSD